LPTAVLAKGTNVREVTQALLDVLASGQRGALATVVRVSGSTPQEPGARLLLRPDGTFIGTVGGGALEHAIQDALREAQRSGRSEYVVRELGYDLAMCCGGRMEVFVEAIEGNPRLFICGAGHVAQPTGALARTTGFDVTIIDERAELNTAERFPDCQREVWDPTTVFERAPLSARDWVLIVTHDHQLDQNVLALALQQQPRYIGLVGSERKVFRLIQRVAASQPDLPLERLYAPVGLDLGAVGPQEIAVSIVAELVALRHGKQVPHLRAVDDLRLGKILEARRGVAG
jgi:xanthine dehydrogenase accessory factor